MNVTLNGRAEQLSDGATIADVLERLEVGDRGVAVAVDAEVVPRGQWSATALHDGARIEIVQAVQGG